jgi:MFS family permease
VSGTAPGPTVPAPSRSGAAIPIAVAGGVTIIVVLPLFLVGALAVQLRSELALSVAGLGAVVAGYRAFTAVLAITVGRVVDRTSASLGLRLGAGLSAVAMLGIATLARSWVALLLWLCLAAVSFAFGQTAVNRFLATSVPPHRRGIAFGLKQSSVPTATLLAGAAVPLIAVTIGWRWVFAIAAVAGLLVVAVVPSSGSARMAGTAAATVGPRPSVRAAVLFALAFGLSMAAASPLGVFLVDHAVASGFSPGRGGLLLSLGSAASIAMRLLVGRAADRREAGHLRWVAGMVLTGVLGYLLLATEVAWLMTLGAVVAFAFGWGFNGLFWYAVLRAHPAAPGAMTGMVMPGSLIGGLVGPLVFGLVAHAASYRVAWIVAASWALAGATAMWACARMVDRQAAAEVRVPTAAPDPRGRPDGP